LANQIGRECRQSLMPIFRPAIFDSYVLTLNVAGFCQAFAQRHQ
jgi:hypothetical protein